MPKTPDEYRSKYNLEPITIESMQNDIICFDTRLAQQVMHNIHNQQGNNSRFSNDTSGNRGRRQMRQSFRGHVFRPRASFHQQNQPNLNRGTRSSSCRTKSLIHDATSEKLQCFLFLYLGSYHQSQSFNTNINLGNRFYPQNNIRPVTSFTSRNFNLPL